MPPLAPICIVLLLSGGAVSSAVQAGQAPDQAPADWRCERCAARSGWDLDLAVAPAYLDEDAYRFGDYTGLDEKGGYLFGSYAGRYQDNQARYFTFDGFSLNPAFTSLNMAGGKQGAYELRASWRSIPRRFYDATVTPFSGNGSDTLILPASWVRTPVTGQMSALAAVAKPVQIERDWEVLQLGFDIKPASSWQVRTDFARTRRKGQNLASASLLFNATELTQPVDYTTDDFELAVDYAAERWQTSVSYRGSFFGNDNEALRFDNPYSDYSDAGQVALAPDNESHQLSVSGSMVLPKRTVLSGQLAVGRLTQDEQLLPYTINPQLAAMPLPAASANAEADTVSLNLRGVTSPWRKVTLEGEVRYHELDNQTPVNVYDYVITDTTAAAIPVRNTAYDYQRTDVKLRGELRATSRLKLQAGVNTRRFERNFQERSRTNTDRLWLRLRHRPGDGAEVALDVFTEDRRGSTYTTLDNPAAEQNPLMRKYNLADRDRYGVRLNGSFYPAPRWDLGWEIEAGEDDYHDSLIGLTESSYLRVGGDFSWLVTDTATVFASFFTEDVDVTQANSQSFSAPDWTATTRDRFTNLAVGFDYPELIGKIGVSVEFNRSDSVGETGSNTVGLRTRFPSLQVDRDTLKLGFDYALRDNWVFGLDYLREKLRSSDWARDGLAPATVPNLLSLGADPFNHTVNLIYLSARYQRRAN